MKLLDNYVSNEFVRIRVYFFFFLREETIFKVKEKKHNKEKWRNGQKEKSVSKDMNWSVCGWRRGCKVNPIHLLSRSWVAACEWWLFSFLYISPHIFLSLWCSSRTSPNASGSLIHMSRLSGGALKVLELVEKVGFAPGSGRNGFPSFADSARPVTVLSRGSWKDGKHTSRQANKLPVGSWGFAWFICVSHSHSPGMEKYTQCLLMEWVAVVRESLL